MVMSEEQKKAVLEKRADSEKISRRIEQGTAYHETVEVYFTDHEKHSIDVYTLSTRQLRTIVEESKVKQSELEKLREDADKAKKEGRPFKPDSAQYGGAQVYFDMLAETAVKNPPNILALLAIGEESKIVIKAFELMSIPKD